MWISGGRGFIPRVSVVALPLITRSYSSCSALTPEILAMAPARTEDEVSWPTDSSKASAPYQGSPRNVKPINDIQWDASLQPRDYEISGTDPDSKILFLDVNILDSTGAEPYRGDVLIEGKQYLASMTLWKVYHTSFGKQPCSP